MPQIETNVRLVKGPYRFACQVVTNGRRLLEILNDSSTKFLKIEEVRMYHRDHSDSYGHLLSGVLLKPQLEMAMIMSQEHEAAERRAYSRVEKNAQEVVVTTPAAQVRGRLHNQSRGDAAQFLAVEAGQFFPVTEAEVFHLDSGEQAAEVPVVLVNRDHVVQLSIGVPVRPSTTVS